LLDFLYELVFCWLHSCHVSIQSQMHSVDILINVDSLPAATQSSCKWHSLLK